MIKIIYNKFLLVKMLEFILWYIIVVLM